MKKLFSLLTVALFATHSVLADEVSREQALQIARQFAASPSTQKLSRRAAPAPPATPQVAFTMPSKVAAGKDNVYVINFGSDQGFVIIAGEDGADDEVLGYCDHGSFSYDEAPIQLKDLLMQYSDEADSLRQHPARAAKAPRRAKDIGTVVVGPLLTTTWNQWAPYNYQCPTGCPTGCYPTAIAQVMNYWKWPKQTQGKLQDDMGTFTGEDFSGHVYDWENMLDSYGMDGTYTYYSDYNDVQANAVAKLMADIGTAFHTSYRPGGSPTLFQSLPLIHNFGYSPDIQEQSGATAAELTAQMKKDLDCHRPILYCGGKSSTDCHALICDGYTSANYFHFNYGWGGSNDGWYKNALVGQFAKNSIILTGIYPFSIGSMEIGDIEYALLANGEAHIKQYNQNKVTDAVVDIPDEITDDEGNAYKVTRIWKNAFWNKGHFNKITLGNHVKSIHQYTFIQSTIDTLIIGDKVQEIPDGAFQTTRIHYLAIGASVKRIGKQAFRMCSLTNIICKSPAVELDDEAFFMAGTGTTDGDGEWLGHITKLGTNVFQGSTFAKVPHFTKLEEIGPEALRATFPKEDVLYTNSLGETYTMRVALFHVYPNLKRVSTTAFMWCDLDGFVIEESPHFSIYPNQVQNRPYSNMLFNNDGSSLVATIPQGASYFNNFSDNVVRLEPGSIISYGYYLGNEASCAITIPSSVVEMEGAFTNCNAVWELRCLAAVPPVVTDTTFNDNIFNHSTQLYVPKGSEELYRNAPGWRRFKKMSTLNEGDYQESDFLPPPTRQYNMVMHYTDEGGRKSVSVPISEVGNMQMAGSGGRVILTRPGQQDMTIDVAQMDSITWMSDFVYDSGEVFNLNDSTLTAKAQYCTVTLGPTVIDEAVQLTIRNAVLKPAMGENVLRSMAVDISLSTGEHELQGAARITIPFEKREGETLRAVYFNRDSGQWEPTYFWYDEEQAAVVILTDHFTEYGVCSLRDVNTPMVKVEKYDLGIWDLNTSLKKLYDIASGDNIDESAIQAWRDDYSFWQSVGIDGGWNALQAIGFSPEAVGKACDAVSYLGTAMTVLDVARADLEGDDNAVAANTLKAICGFASGQMASAIGTSIMNVSMIGVATIGILLEKLGTMVQQRKHDLIRDAYRFYYSEAGYKGLMNWTKYKDGDLSQDFFGREQKYPHNQWRSKKDWFMYFRGPLEEGKIKPENYQMLIEQAVRMYCQRFWDDNYDAREMACTYVGAQSMTSLLDADDDYALQQQISDEYYAELMNGEITEVFQQLREYCEVAAGKRFEKAEEDLKAIMNTVMILKLYDSTRKAGEKSKYAGWKLRFTEMPVGVADSAQWECTIADDGTAMLQFTKYALIKNKIKCKFTLVDDRDIDQKIYEYRITEHTGKIICKLDIAKGGTEVEAPALKDLELVYDPAVIETFYTWMGTWNNGQDYNESYPETYVYLNNLLNKRARFQTEIEKFFKQHDFIVVDPYGNIKIGDDIMGKMEGDEGKGAFTIDTTHLFTEQTISEYVEAFNRGDFVSIELFQTLLDGTIQHKIDCQFTVTRIADGEGYAVSYTGNGTYAFKANVVDIVEGVDFDNLGNPQHVTSNQIHTREVTQNGTVKLNYVIRLR